MAGIETDVVESTNEIFSMVETNEIESCSCLFVEAGEIGPYNSNPATD